MKKLIAYPLSVLFNLFFGLTLLVFHPIQWICFYLFGYRAHKISVSWMAFFVNLSARVLGTHFSYQQAAPIPKNRPLIVVANHQNLFDIPFLIWKLRAHHPKFIAKKSLGKNIPSVSFNLNHGGSVLIERNNREQSLKAISSLGAYIEKTNRTAVIFPEGTRSKNGKPRPFKKGGLKILLANAPNALILPITINNSWKINRWGSFPNGIGSHIKFTFHPLLENRGEVDTLIDQIEKTIVNSIEIESHDR